MGFKVIILCCYFIAAQATFIGSRIIGGIEAEKHEFPHLVSIQLAKNGKHNCGGAIIADRWILTAAHCVHQNLSEIYVKAGKHNVKIVEESEQTSEVIKSFVHQKYKPGWVAPFDIALLKLDTPLIFNKYIAPIKLSTTDTLPKDEVTMAGWGTVSDPESSFPAVSQKVYLSIIDLKTCINAVVTTTGQSDLHETNICTGPLTGGQGGCYGDSGSPLITRVNNYTEVIGVFSWITLPCAAPGRVSVYVKVSAFIDWIHDIILHN